MKFAEKLKLLREDAEMTQEELAKRSGVPIGTIRGYEQGIRMGFFPAVVAMSKALGKDCTVFADCDDVQAEVKPTRKRKTK